MSKTRLRNEMRICAALVMLTIILCMSYPIIYSRVTSPVASQNACGPIVSTLEEQNHTSTPQITQVTTHEQGNYGTPLEPSVILSSDPPNGTYWARTYGSPYEDGASSVAVTPDGGYVVAGGGGGYGGTWMFRLDAGGEVVWQKTYSSGSPASVAVTPDGGYVVAGTVHLSMQDFWVLRLDAAGAIVWQKAYGDGDYDRASSMAVTLDGGCIVVGNTFSFGVGKGDFWVLRLDAAGEEMWQKSYGGSQYDDARSVAVTPDGGYIVAGYSRSFSAIYDYDYWILKLDAGGAVVWEKSYGGTDNEEAYSVVVTPDGGCIVAGQSLSFGVGTLMLRLDAGGEVVWQKSYGGPNGDFVRSVAMTEDGGCVAAGCSYSFGTNYGDFWMLRLDAGGEVVWQKTYFGSYYEGAVSPFGAAYSVAVVGDGGYIVTGSTAAFGVANRWPDIWVVKVDTDGDIAWNLDSGASTSTTNATSADTAITPATTSATPMNTTCTITSLTTTPLDTDAIIAIQSGPDIIPPATILDLAASSPTGVSITLTWTAPGDDSSAAGTATGYIVKYSTNGPITAGTWNAATTYMQTWTPLASRSMETHVITDLLPGTTYWFAIMAYDNVPNYNNVSNSPSETTTTPPAAIIDLAATSVTSTSITLTWTAPGGNGTLGTAAGYIMKYSTNGAITTSTWETATTYMQTWTPLASGSAETHVVSGLLSGTTYWFAVVAYDEVPYYGDVSNSPSGTTAPASGPYWAKTFGGTGHDSAYSVVATGDGGYIVVGYAQSWGDTDVWVLKLDAWGGVMWQKTYGGTGSDLALCVMQTTDGGYIVAGSTTSFGAGMEDVWVLKLDAEGGVTWQKSYGGTGSDVAYSLSMTGEGGYIVAGFTESFGAGGPDVWVLKLDAEGGVTWQKSYGGTHSDYAWSIAQTADGEYVVAGVTESFGAGKKAWVLKLDATGEVTWQKTYGDGGGQCAYSVGATCDGGCIIVGYTHGSGGEDIWVLKLDAAGGVVWQKSYGGTGSDVAWSVAQMGEGGYIIAGRTNSFGSGGRDVWMLKLDAAGGVTWQKTYGGPNDDAASSVAQMGEDGYIVAGVTASFGAGNLDFWVVKVRVNSDIVWNLDSGASTFTTYATPTDTVITPAMTSATLTSATGTSTDSMVTPLDTDAIMVIQAGPDTIPPATILNLAASSPTETSIILMWTAPGDDGSVGTATNYILGYSTSGPINASNWWLATIYYPSQSWVPLPAGSIESHVITGFAPGTIYWFAIYAFDEAGNPSGISNSPSGTTTPPTPAWDQLPTSRVFEFGSGFVYDVNASCFSGIDHYWLNDTVHFAVDGNGVITNTTSLPVGVYWVEVRAYNPYTNYCSATFSVTVLDTTSPTWNQTPISQVVEFNTHFRYDMNASDASNIHHYWLNDTVHFAVDSNGVITNTISLPVGVYGVEVRAYDPYSNYCSATFKVTVQDTASPTWNVLPTNRVVEYDNAFRYDVNALDFSGIDYYWLNDTVHFTVDSNGVITNTTLLPVGVYWVEVRAYDPYSNYCSATFMVTVQDTTPPTWLVNPIDQVVAYGFALDYQLQAIDDSGIDHWAINDTVHFAISSTGRLTSTTTLGVGHYGLTITVYDSYNNARSASITITVQAQNTTAPPPPPMALMASATGVLVVVLVVVLYLRKKR